jgi:hypothetical protein
LGLPKAPLALLIFYYLEDAGKNIAKKTDFQLQLININNPCLEDK